MSLVLYDFPYIFGLNETNMRVPAVPGGSNSPLQGETLKASSVPLTKNALKGIGCLSEQNRKLLSKLRLSLVKLSRGLVITCKD